MSDEAETFKESLDVVRTLHRLIISVSLVCIVFSLALDIPKELRDRHRTIKAFVNYNFTQYDLMMEEKLRDYAHARLHAISEEVWSGLAESNPGVIGLREIDAAFESPILLGALRVHETTLATPAEMTWSSLDGLARSFRLHDDVRVAVPSPASLMPLLIEYLGSEAKLGMRVQNVRIETVEYYSSLPTERLPRDNSMITLLLSFELISVGQAPSPVFSGAFDAHVETIEGTSFTDWLLGQDNHARIAKIDKDVLAWLPDFAQDAQQYAGRRLGEVLASLEEQIERGSPEKQSVSLLGTEVPGGLLIYAAPSVLLVLAYYLLCHLRHVNRHAYAHASVCRGYAWLPLSLKSGQWLWEACASTALLPLISLIIMLTQILRFGSIRLATILIVLIAAGILGVLAVRIVREIKDIRQMVTR